MIETDIVTFESVKNFLSPNLWMPELHDTLQGHMSPIHKHLDHIDQLLEDLNEVQTFKLERMLFLAKESDSTFQYVMGMNAGGDFKGCCWQTGVMRSSFERFGHNICMDGMKRELNDKHWCYLAVTVLNDKTYIRLCYSL